VNPILEDLTTLSPKRLEKRLGQLAEAALPCVGVSVFDGSPEHGLTVALSVDAHDRGDVLDLARVVEDDSAVSASAGWSLLSPARRHPYWRLLLRVSLERPVSCDFTAAFEIRIHASDPMRLSLPLLLAADRFVFDFEGRSDTGRPLVWLVAPAARECVLDALCSSRG
jgi:hypothetical protein